MRRPLVPIVAALAAASLLVLPPASAVEPSIASSVRPAESVLGTNAADEAVPLHRVAGVDRYETAAKVSERWEPGVPVAYVVSGENFPDALSGGAWAASLGAPVLLTRQPQLPAVTAQALARLKPQRMVVVGGESSVSESVVTTLKGLAVTGQVSRIAGADRYITAASVAGQYSAGLDRVVLASGQEYPDALSGAALAGHESVPLLLTRRDRLDAATIAQLQRIRPNEVLVLGGTSRVSQSVSESAAHYAGGSVRRLAGGNRYETASLVAAEFGPTGGGAFVASGDLFPDALIGAALAGREGVPVHLTPWNRAHEATLSALQEQDPDSLTVFGGQSSVTEPTAEDLARFARDGYVEGWGYPSWRDEFAGTSVDTTKWTVRDRSTHGNLSYDQGVISSDAVTVADGMLRIRVTELPEPEQSGGQTRWWQTGYLDTINKHTAQYGRWEFRAKLPTTAGNSRGLWPAFWLRNGNVGEIDILESWGDPPVRQRSSNLTETSTFTVHQSTNGGGAKAGYTYEHNAFPGEAPYNSASEFRTWAVEYTPDYLKAYLDGELAVHIVPSGELVTGQSRNFSWVWGSTFASPWNIRLNYQVGDPYWSPNISPSNLTVVPSDYLVDYVRFWDYIG